MILDFCAERTKLLAELNEPIITSPPYPSEPPTAAAIAAEYEIAETKKKRVQVELAKEVAFCTALGTADIDTLLGAVQMAHYLEFEPLLTASCNALAAMLKAKSSPDEIRKLFKLTYDFTPEEEDEIIKQNPWCSDLASDPFLQKAKATAP
jgi:hypothetical protein